MRGSGPRGAISRAIVETALAQSKNAPPSPPRSPRPPVTRVVLAIAVVVAAGAVYLAIAAGRDGTGASAAGQTGTVAARGAGDAPRAEQLRVRVIASYPHDRESYTQGLLWEQGGTFVESAGGYGDSMVRRWRPNVARPVVEERLPDRVFGEGLTAVDDALVQLTWREGVAFYRDRQTLREVARRAYDGEGWGLCYDGTHLFMSDGSYVLTRRDPQSFLEVGRIAVVADGAPLANLNELECAEGSVFANVYQTDRIARIDPTSGRVTALIDA